MTGGTTRSHCLICGGCDLETIIDLGVHPFADTFVKPATLLGSEYVQNLVCDYCVGCGHTQLRHITDPLKRYVDTDYSYTSSNSEYSRKYWCDYAKAVTEEIALPLGSKVLELGSNDGFLLSQLKSDYEVLGVDPSPHMAKLATERAIDTKVDLFSSRVAESILLEHGSQRLVIANNVLNHTDDPSDFVSGVSSVLDDEGWFVFEFPYWLRTVADRQFDQIYHEHVSYFSVKSIAYLLTKFGFAVKRVKKTEYHGGSLRVYAKKGKTSNIECVEKLTKIEVDEGLHSVSRYHDFMKEITASKHKFMMFVHKEAILGNPLICIGAGAKANTFLNFYGLDYLMVECLTDTSPHKIGKLAPLSRIPICHDDVLSNYKFANVVLTSWNLANVLRPKILLINPNIRLVNAFE